MPVKGFFELEMGGRVGIAKSFFIKPVVPLCSELTGPAKAMVEARVVTAKMQARISMLYLPWQSTSIYW